MTELLHSGGRIPTATAIEMWRKSLTRYKPSQTFEIEKAIAHKKIVNRIFDAVKGEDDVTRKLESLNVRLTSPAVVEVVKELPINSAWAFFCWARGHNDFKHNTETYLSIIKKFGSAKVSDHINQLLEDMKKDGCELNSAAYRGLMRAHGKAGELDEALQLWDTFKQAGFELTVESYNCVLGILLTAKRHAQALQYYREMLQAHCSPNADTYHYLIESLVASQKLQSAYVIIKKMPRLGVRPYQPTYQLLVKANLKANDLDTVTNLLLQMKDTNRDPNAELMAKVRKAFKKAGKSTEILANAWESYFAYAREPSGGDTSSSAKSDEGTSTGSEFEDTDEDLDIDKGTLASVLKPWGPETAQKLEKMKFTWTTKIASYLMKDLEDADVAFGFFEWLRFQDGFQHDVLTYTKMVTILLSARRFPIVDCLLSEMHERGIQVDTWLFNQIIECYSSCHDAEGALKIFGKMEEMGTQPNAVVYTGMIDVLMREGMYQRAMEVYGQMLQAGHEPNNFTYSVLINGLGIAGKAEAGHKLLSIMLKHGYQPNVITYTALIGGYEKLGKLSNALEVFKEMQAAGIEPTPITYRILSHAYYRAGRWDQGRNMEQKLQELMSSDIGARVMEENRISNCREILKTLEDLAVLDG